LHQRDFTSEFSFYLPQLTNITNLGLKFSILLGLNYIYLAPICRPLTWVPYRRFLSSANTVLRVMEAHKCFHHLHTLKIISTYHIKRT